MGTGSSPLGGGADTSVAYTQNWDRKTAENNLVERYMAGGRDMVLLSKNGHYSVAENWSVADYAKKNGWKYESFDAKKIRKEAEKRMRSK